MIIDQHLRPRSRTAVSLVLGFVALATQLTAQRIPAADTITVGHSALDGRVIYGETYTFGERIFRVHLDSNSQLLTVRLRETKRNGKYWKNHGTVVQYDLTSGRTLWRMPITYGIQTLFHAGSELIYFDGKKSYLIDAHTGARLWEVKNNIYYANSTAGIGIGYLNRPNRASVDKQYNTLQGIRLDDGAVLWERVVSRTYGWHDLIAEGDSVVTIGAAGLHRVNLYTGDGWAYEAPTGVKKRGAQVATNVAGALVGALTGAFFFDTSPDIVRGAHSNVVLDSSSNDLFHATREEIVRINPSTGHIVWRRPLVAKSGSSARLIVADSAVYLVSLGSGMMGQRSVQIGEPSLAAFAKTDGQPRYRVTLGDAEHAVVGMRLIDSAQTVFVAFADRVEEYDVSTGRLLATAYPQLAEPITGFAGDHVFTVAEADARNAATRLHTLLKDEGEQMYIIADGEVYALDIASGTASLRDDSTFYYLQGFAGEKRLLARTDGAVVADIDDRVVARFDAPGGILAGGKLIRSEGSILTVIDLRQLDN